MPDRAVDLGLGGPDLLLELRAKLGENASVDGDAAALHPRKHRDVRSVEFVVHLTQPARVQRRFQ